MNRLTTLLAATTFALAGCDVPQGSNSPIRVNEGFSVVAPGAPSGAVVDRFAINFLNTLQPRSIRERREYCGYIILNQSGQLEATPPRPGTFAGCNMPAPQVGEGIIASYQTHGAYGPRYDNEVPSTVDLMSDFDFGMDGYVSTPGGRVWLVDFQTRTTRQLCGLSCVYVDPGFVPQNEAGVRQVYDLEGIQRRQGFTAPPRVAFSTKE